jgi:hypothetical protein
MTPDTPKLLALADDLQLAFKLMQAQFIASRNRLQEELEQIAAR